MPKILPVSLLATCLNEERNVAQFFDSLFSGSKVPAEIIVCDGGSTDSTVARLKQIQYPNVTITVLTEPGATIARGRNVAASQAKYEVFAVTDFGCEVSEHWLERITAPLLSDPDVDVVSGGYVVVGRTFFEEGAAAAEIPVSHQNPETFLPSSRSFALRRSAFLDAGMYPENLSFAGEDTALCLRLKSLGKNFAHRWTATVSWYPRSSLSHFIKQHFLYGVGDGEARSRIGFFAKTLIKWVFFIAFVFVIRLHPSWVYFLAGALLLYYYNLRLKYAWREIRFHVSILAFVLIAVKELSMLAGFFKGLLIPAGKKIARV